MPWKFYLGWPYMRTMADSLCYFAFLLVFHLALVHILICYLSWVGSLSLAFLASLYVHSLWPTLLPHFDLCVRGKVEWVWFDCWLCRSVCPFALRSLTLVFGRFINARVACIRYKTYLNILYIISMSTCQAFTLTTCPCFSKHFCAPC